MIASVVFEVGDEVPEGSCLIVVTDGWHDEYEIGGQALQRLVMKRSAGVRSMMYEIVE